MNPAETPVDPDMEPVGADAELADQLEDVRAVVAILGRQVDRLTGEVEGLTERLVNLMGTVEQVSAVVAIQTDLIAALTPKAD